MTADHSLPEDVPEIRETYIEHSVEQDTVGTIADPENAAAWIQSTVTQPLEP